MRTIMRRARGRLSVLGLAATMAACGGGVSKNAAPIQPAGTGFHYSVADDGSLEFHSAEALHKQESALSGQYFGFNSSGFVVHTDAELDKHVFDLTSGPSLMDCGGVDDNTCPLVTSGKLLAESGLRYRYKLDDKDRMTSGHIALNGNILVSAVPRLDDNTAATLAVGKRRDVDDELTAGDYRVFLRQCDPKGCRGSDLRLSIFKYDANTFVVDSVTRLGGASQRLIRAGMMIQKANWGGQDPEEDYQLADDTHETTSSILSIPLANGGKALTFGQGDITTDNVPRFFGFGVLQQPHSIATTGLWRGWTSDGKPSYARSAVAGETSNVVDGVVYGGAPASAHLKVLQGGPVMATLRTDTGEMFVGLKELDTIVPDPDAVKPELSPDQLK